METLIELYDERAIENVLGPETFRPGRVIYLCPEEIGDTKHIRKILKSFFERRGLDIQIEFETSSMYRSDRILKQLRGIADKYNDCAVDVTGGTDAALFAAGRFCQERNIPAFTYSRKRNRFYDINNAPFANAKICEIEYSVEDFFKMTGGTLRQGRVDNAALYQYMNSIDDFFKVFMKHQRSWSKDITYFQRISRSEKGMIAPLNVSGSWEQKGEHGSRVKANPQLLKDLEKIGYIKDLKIDFQNEVSFAFADEQIRVWLRDVGAALEVYMYKICSELGVFKEVISSAVVDWDGTVGKDSVSNEIDVVAVRTVIPVFISCKACEVKTEAINELSILRDRFGGKGAKAIIVSTEYCNSAARHRAANLDISIIDKEELEGRMVSDRLIAILNN